MSTALAQFATTLRGLARECRSNPMGMADVLDTVARESELAAEADRFKAGQMRLVEPYRRPDGETQRG